MFTKEESRNIKQEFWTAFGVMMKSHHSASGFRVNWINYKTEVKDILFKLVADKKQISISIQLRHKDEGIRRLYLEQFEEFKSLLHTTLEEEWNWDNCNFDEFGKEYASISITSKGNIFDKNQWQDMFAFFKSRLIKLDKFWDDAKEMFKSL